MELNSYKYYILQLAFCIRILAFCIRILPSSILHYAYCIRLYGHWKSAAAYSIMHCVNCKLPYCNSYSAPFLRCRLLIGVSAFGYPHLCACIRLRLEPIVGPGYEKIIAPNVIGLRHETVHCCKQRTMFLKKNYLLWETY